MQQNRRPLYAKIALARKQLAMDETTYREMLQTRFQVKSSSDLSFTDLSRLVQYMAELGAVFTSKGSNKKVKPQARPDWINVTGTPYEGEKRQILAIWKKLNYSMSSLDTRVKRAFGVEIFVWMQDYNQICALLNDLQRRERSFDKKNAKAS